ncbi:MAG: cobalamin B12-binding domain-containing protein [Candidatus Omnitrophota bacterium]
MASEKLDLVLVNPGSGREGYGNIDNTFRGIEPPVWCGLIAGFMRSFGYSVRIIDADALNWDPEYTAEKIVKYNPILAGIIVLGTNPAVSSTPKMPVARKILSALREKSPDIKTVLAGLHPSALPEQTLREEQVDFVCQGECFYTILELLKMLKSGKQPDTREINGLWYRKK